MSNAKNLSSQVVSFTYLNNPIRFSVNGSVMINATNMAKPFKKLPAGWLRLNSTKDFIKHFSVMRNHITADLVRVKNGGNPQLQGTWMHEDVALEFARWLSPEFAIWCNDRIKEIIRSQTPSVGSFEINSLKYRLELSEKTIAILRKCIDSGTDSLKLIGDVALMFGDKLKKETEARKQAEEKLEAVKALLHV